MVTIYDFTKENLKEYYLKNNITNYKKNNNGDPDMRYGENRRKMASIIKARLLDKNLQENMKNYNDTSYYDYKSEIINITDREIRDFF
tara:strand:- start:41 stop:304 length:264 start_codon:yes stop_codon:yes gene_type:complete